MNRARRQGPDADQSTPDNSEASQRIDKWLWAARFFKTRSAAAKAVCGGMVVVDGDRVKPALMVRAGTTLKIRRGVMEFEVLVCGICAQRRPASEAALLYQETPQSITARNEEKERQVQEERRRQMRVGRPDKHARRELSRLKGR
jgi:ribosome-associated heat shock protein Hsp15